MSSRGDDPLGPRAELAVWPAHHLQGWNPVGSAQVGVHGGFEGANAQLVASPRAEERLPLERRDKAPSPGDDSGLRAAEQLVAAEAYQRDILSQYLGGRRLVLQPRDRFRVDHRAAAKIFDERYSSAASQR